MVRATRVFDNRAGKRLLAITKFTASRRYQQWITATRRSSVLCAQGMMCAGMTDACAPIVAARLESRRTSHVHREELMRAAQ